MKMVESQRGERHTNGRKSWVERRAERIRSPQTTVPTQRPETARARSVENAVEVLAGAMFDQSVAAG